MLPFHVARICLSPRLLEQLTRLWMPWAILPWKLHRRGSLRSWWCRLYFYVHFPIFTYNTICFFATFSQRYHCSEETGSSSSVSAAAEWLNKVSFVTPITSKVFHDEFRPYRFPLSPSLCSVSMLVWVFCSDGLTIFCHPRETSASFCWWSALNAGCSTSSVCTDWRLEPK